MKKIIIVLVMVNLICGTIWLASFLWNSHKQDEKLKRETTTAAGWNEKAGYLKKDSYLRLVQLSRSLKSTGELSDRDVDWICSAIQDSLKKDYPHGSMGRFYIGWALEEGLKKVGASQRHKLYNSILPMLNTKDESDAYAMDKAIFCGVSMRLGEPKAIADMLPLLNDPRQRVRKKAKIAIEYLEKHKGNPYISN